jgi:beta-1,4-mannosyltransferase
VGARLNHSFERKFGKRAYCHLFVTRALEEYLTREWHLEGRTAVLHDRPPSQFRRTEVITLLNVSWTRRGLQLTPALPSPHSHDFSTDARLA